MPHTVKYRPELMESILTAKRLLSYERVFGKLSDRELVGIYVWNQVTGGALYPLLSAAEVTLRNAIDTAFIHFSGKIFRGVWPASSGTATLSTARKLTKTVREYRNRLAHNEPIWKAYPVSTPAEAVAYISGKIDAIEQLIGLLSPEKLDLLTKHGLFAEARQLNSLAGIASFSTSPLTRAQATARCGQVTRR